MNTIRIGDMVVVRHADFDVHALPKATHTGSLTAHLRVHSADALARNDTVFERG